MSFVYSLVDSHGKPFEECPVDEVDFPEGNQPDVMDFRKAVWTKNSVILTGILAPQLQVFKNKEAFEKRNLTEGREDPLDDDFVINNSLGQSKAEALIVAVPPPRGIKRPLSDEDILMQELIDIANQGNQCLKQSMIAPNPNLLVTGGGFDFQFLNREDSFDILADLISERYLDYNKNNTDRNRHSIPYLADGPGTGKSRFLQELPYSFRQYFTSQPEYSDELKSVIESAVYINVTFGNGSTSIYDTSVSIKTALCLRILHQFCTDKKLASFSDFYSKYRHADISLSFIRNNLLPGIKCFVLGIDELNHITNPQNIEDLICYIGSECCYCGGETFFVPILAGTNIKALDNSFKASKFIGGRIPLPLLSYQSCVDILIGKEPACAEWLKDSFEFRQLVADVGGYPRPLEFLFQSALKHSDEPSNVRWINTKKRLLEQLKSRYPLMTYDLEYVIAHAFVPFKVKLIEKWPLYPEKTFYDLCESGMIKLDENDFVQMPYSFIWIYLDHSVMGRNNQYALVWQSCDLHQSKNWQDFETFNADYILLRFASFAILKIEDPRISLETLFYGSVMTITKFLKVPKLSDLKPHLKLKEKTFPYNDAHFENYQMVLNTDGAAFDAFMYIESIENERILLLFQMEQSANHRPMKLTTKMIHNEYDKCEQSINRHLPGTKFILVIIARLHGNYDPKSLPENTIVICQENMHAFYRDALYRKIMAGKPI